MVLQREHLLGCILRIDGAYVEFADMSHTQSFELLGLILDCRFEKRYQFTLSLVDKYIN